MIQYIFYIFFAGILFCMPVLFWMYVCTGNMQNYFISRRQFFFGIIAGALSAGIFAYLPKSQFSFLFDNIFLPISENIELIFPIGIFSSLGIFFFFLSTIIVFFLFVLKKKLFSVISFSFIYYMLLIFLATLGIMFFLFGMRGEISQGISFGMYSFISFGSLISYYLIIALSEEGLKYFTSLGSITKKIIQCKNYFLLTGLTVALGFSFFETGLYAYFYFVDQPFDSGFLKLIFFRNIFSLSLHVLCSLLMSLAFWYILFAISKKYVSRIALFVIFGIISLGIHIIFDMSLHFGFLAIIFLCVGVLYIFFSYIMGVQEAR